MRKRFKAELQELDSGLRLDRPREAQEETQEGGGDCDSNPLRV